MANRRFTQFFNTLHTKPILIDCNFVVDSTNGNGLGIRSLKGAGVQNVFMKTSATPATGNTVVQNGLIMVQFQDTYNRYFGGFSGQVSPVTGANLTVGLTVGSPYVITSLGASTAAQWIAAGVPLGITPAVGVSFIAIATSIAGGGAVKAVTASGIQLIEVVGDPNLTLTSTRSTVLGSSSGAYMLLQCLGATAAGDTTLIPKAPVNGSVIGLSFYLSGSRILVQGE